MDKEKIEKKIKGQPLFIIIQDKLVIPNESRKIKITLSKRELKTNKYLEEMFSVVDSLHGSKISSEAGNKKQVIEEIEEEKDNEREL